MALCSASCSIAPSMRSKGQGATPNLLVLPFVRRAAGTSRPGAERRGYGTPFAPDAFQKAATKRRGQTLP